jgi:glutaredoxin
VFWQPGCTSCLRTKEFLTKRGIPFVSRNVLTDQQAFEALAAHGLRQVPIVMRGGAYADGQVLAEVARLVGIDYGASVILPVPELGRRLDEILAATGRWIAQVPADKLATELPNRPRSYGNLAFHIFNIADAFLEHDAGIPLEFDAYNRIAPVGWGHRHLAAYGSETRRRISNWLVGPGQDRDWSQPAEVYYGRQTLHEFLERTTWHAGQHTRQLMWVLEQHLEIAPDQPLAADIWRGLPMPDSIWDPA